MNGKALIPLIAGLCIGGFALKIGYDTLKSAKAAPTVYVKVWAAKEDITRGTDISEAVLTTLAYPQKSVPAGAILEKDKDKLVGRVARIDAPANLPILDSMLHPEGARPGIHVRPGFRAVAVKIDESSGVDYHIQPGSRVDVVGYFTINRGGKQETISRTVIENAEVGAVGQRLVATTSEDKDAKGANVKQARAVTLFVRPEHVTSLHLAEQRGKIKLSLRGDEDHASGAARAVSDSEVIEGRRRDEEEPPSGSDSKSGSVFELFAKAFGSKAAPPPAPVEPPVIPVVAPPPPPAEPTWDIVVQLGNRLEVVKFKNRNSRERVDEAVGRSPAGAACAASAPGNPNVVVVPLRPQNPPPDEPPAPYRMPTEDPEASPREFQPAGWPAAAPSPIRVHEPKELQA